MQRTRPCSAWSLAADPGCSTDHRIEEVSEVGCLSGFGRASCLASLSACLYSSHALAAANLSIGPTVATGLVIPTSILAIMMAVDITDTADWAFEAMRGCQVGEALALARLQVYRHALCCALPTPPIQRCVGRAGRRTTA